MLEPASRFSNTAETGMRVLRNTQAPLRLPGTLSTAGHFDQSRVGIGETPSNLRINRITVKVEKRVWSAGRRVQQPLHPLRIACNDLQIGLGLPIWLGAALFPVSESAEGNVVADGQFLLRQRQGAANDSRLWRSPHPLEIAGCRRLRAAVGPRARLNASARHA